MIDKRNSSIELLKIIAVVMIVISHSLPFGIYNNYDSYVNLELCTKNNFELIMAIIRYFGNIGNCIFIVCSAYFLLDSKKIKKEKICKIVANSFIISITMLFLFKFVFNVEMNIASKDIIQMIFPITFQLNWFLSCYLIIYIIHPLLNSAINNLSEKQHLLYMLFFIFIYSILNTIKNGVLYYNYLIGFIIIYFVVAYVKKYKNEFCTNKSLNIKISVVAYSILVLSVLLINYLGIHHSFFQNKLQHLNTFSNPLIILLCICLFNIFNSKKYHNKIFNYISSLSLLIYIIHGNPFIVGWLKGAYFDYLSKLGGYSSINMSVYIIVLFLIFIIGSTIISIGIDSIENIILKKRKKKQGEFY